MGLPRGYRVGPRILAVGHWKVLPPPRLAIARHLVPHLFPFFPSEFPVAKRQRCLGRHSSARIACTRTKTVPLPRCWKALQPFDGSLLPNKPKQFFELSVRA